MTFSELSKGTIRAKSGARSSRFAECVRVLLGAGA